MNAYFNLVWILLLVFAALYNYIYQDQKQQKPWPYYPARYFRPVAIGLAMLSMVGLLVAELG